MLAGIAPCIACVDFNRGRRKAPFANVDHNVCVTKYITIVTNSVNIEDPHDRCRGIPSIGGSKYKNSKLEKKETSSNEVAIHTSKKSLASSKPVRDGLYNSTVNAGPSRTILVEHISIQCFDPSI